MNIKHLNHANRLALESEPIPKMIPAGYMTETLLMSNDLNSDLMFQNLKNMCCNTLFPLDFNSGFSEAIGSPEATQPKAPAQKKCTGFLDRILFGNRFKFSVSASEKMLRRADEIAIILRNKEDLTKITFEDYFNYLLWIPFHKDTQAETITVQFVLDAFAIFFLEVKKSRLGKRCLADIEIRDIDSRYRNLGTCFTQVALNSLNGSLDDDHYKRFSNSMFFYVLLHAEIVNGIQMNFAVEFGSNGLIEVKA